jgi:hypothetical protein
MVCPWAVLGGTFSCGSLGLLWFWLRSLDDMETFDEYE